MHVMTVLPASIAAALEIGSSKRTEIIQNAARGPLNSFCLLYFQINKSHQFVTTITSQPESEDRDPPQLTRFLSA